MEEAAQHSAGISIIDISVAVILLLSAILAFMRGFLREAVSLATWTGAFFATIYLYPVVQPWMRTQIDKAIIADGATAVTLFCVALIILIPIGSMIANIVKGNTLTAIDRSLGFVFGLLRGMLVACLMYLGALVVWPQPDMQPDWIASAKTRPLLEAGAGLIKSFIPEYSQNEAKVAIQKAEETKKNLDNANSFLQQLTIPKPGANKGSQPAYDANERQSLEQLIEKQANE